MQESSWMLISLLLFSAVANVTTAVDIYSFGMCALEVRGDFVCSDQLVTQSLLLFMGNWPDSGSRSVRM